jgi:hypothetical protein
MVAILDKLCTSTAVGHLPDLLLVVSQLLDKDVVKSQTNHCYYCSDHRHHYVIAGLISSAFSQVLVVRKIVVVNSHGCLLFVIIWDILYLMIDGNKQKLSNVSVNPSE